MKKTLTKLTAGAVLLLAIPSAHASLIADTVRLQFGITGSTPVFDATAVVADPGVEFSIPLPNPIPVDVHSDSFDISVDLTGFGDLGFPTTFILSDLDWLSPGLGFVTGITLTSGLISEIASTSFTADSVTVNFVNFTNPPVNHNFSFAIETSHLPVPEPSTSALYMFSAFAMIGWFRRKQQA